MKKDDSSYWHLLRKFLTIYLPKHRGYGKNTIETYCTSLRVFHIYLNNIQKIPLLEITWVVMQRQMVFNFLEWLQKERKCSASTINLRLASLKSFLAFASAEDPALMSIYIEIRQIPAMKVVKKGVDYLTRSAVKALMNQPDLNTKKGIRDRMIMILLYDTGARITELLSIKVNDLLFDIKVPCVYLHGKGDKVRCIPLMDKTIAHLKEYLRIFHPSSCQIKSSFLFYSPITGRTGSLSVDAVAFMIKKYCKKASKVCIEVPLGVHPHQFRHTRAQHLYQDGMPLSYIAEFLGHSSMNTTKIYAAADTAMMRQAIEKTGVIETGTVPCWKDNDDLIRKLCGL